MPYDEVMGKFKRGTLRSGSDKGPPVKSRDQAIAIMMSEKKKAAAGVKEYQAHDDGGDVKPTNVKAGDTKPLPSGPSPKSTDRLPSGPIGRDPNIHPKNLPAIPPTVGPNRNLPSPMSPGMREWPQPTLKLPIYGSGGKGTLIVPDKGKEEWQPSGDWGENTRMQPLQRATPTPAPALPPHGGATGEWKKGGKVGMPREEWEPSQPKEKPGGGMFPIGGQSREEWEPQQNPGPQSNFPGSTEDKDYPDISKPVRADTRVTGVKKGGPMKRYDDGGPVSGDARSPDFQPSTEVKISIPHPSQSQTKPRAPSKPSKPSSDDSSTPSLPSADMPNSQVPIPTMVNIPSSAPAVAKGGPIGKFNKGGEACASNAKQFKQNIAETMANPTEPIGFAKGGEVGWKKPSWRRW